MTAPVYDHLNTLSEPLRVRLLRVLEREELGVGELARVIQSPQSTVSRHLKILLQRGWLEKRSAGTANLFSARLELPEGGQALWEAVRDQVDGTCAEDLRRLRAVLAQRPVDSREFFGRLGGDWDHLRQELYGGDFLLPTLLALLPGDQVIGDLGCGTGDTLAALSPAVARIVGIDREESMLSAARQHTADCDNVELRQGPLEDLPLPDAHLDAALCMLVLHHVVDPGTVLAEARRVLRPTGRLLVLDMVAHDRESYRRTMGHVHLGFAREAFEGLASEAGLEVHHWRVLPPDPTAQGPSLFLAVLRPCAEAGL